MKLLSLDLETSGVLDEFALQPWRVQQRKAWVTTVSIAIRETGGKMASRGWIMPFREDRTTTDDIYAATRERLRKLLVKAAKEEWWITTWNGTFDVAFMLAYNLEAEVFACRWFDGMRLWKHLDNEPTYMGRRHYALLLANRAFEKQYADIKVADYHTATKAARDTLLEDNCNDCEAALLHTERFWPQLTERQQVCARIEAACIPIVSQANLGGLTVDVENCLIVDKLMRDIGNMLAEKLAPHNCHEKIIRSPAKLRKLLFEQWDLPIIKYTINQKTGEETDTASTDKEVLHELATDDERVLWLGQWREALNLRTKFVTSLRRSAAYNGDCNETHPEAIIFSTYTSRMTYASKQGRGQKNERPTGFAIHQMKNDKRFRNSIVAPEGYDIVEADAAGQEFRWMAILSGDPTMLSLCEVGGDPHSFLAAQIYGEDYELLKQLVKSQSEELKEEATKKRKLGKVGNLSLQYRTSKKKLRIVARIQYNMPMTEDLAEHTWKTYRKSYPGVPDYWKSQIAFAKAHRYVETIPGRRVAVEGDWEGPHKWAMESTAINDPVQGTGGEQKYLALARLRNDLRRFNTRFGWDLHDGIYFLSPKDKSMAFAHHLKTTLDNLPYQKAWGFKSPIPLPWDVKIGPAWGSLKEVEF